MKSRPIPCAVKNLDALPDSARIDLTALRHVTGRSRSTIYRWVALGILPSPQKPADGMRNTWTVGEVRRALNFGA